MALVVVFCTSYEMQSQIINDQFGKPKDNSQRINVWLDAEGRGDTIELIRIMLANNTKREQILNYEMVLQQKETETTVDRKQGFIESKPGQVKMIAKVPANFSPNDKFRLDIEIYDQRLNVMDRDSLLRGKFKSGIAPKKVITVSAKDPETEIGGLVIDLTKSKQGRDFFELFYQGYSSLGKQASNNIIVEELPARGTISRIGVKVNETLIFQRFLTPRASIVEENANFAVQVIASFLQNNENLDKQLENEDVQGTGIF